MVYAAVRSGPAGQPARRRRPGGRRSRAGRAQDRSSNPDWVAVAATNWWAAATALDAIRPRFHVPDGLPDSRSDPARAAARARIAATRDRLYESGDMGARLSRRQPDRGALRGRPRPLRADRAADRDRAASTGDRLEIWAPTQAPGLARAAAARALGLAEGQVTLYPTLAGGGYGRKLETDAIEQAAILARAHGPAGPAHLAAHPGDRARHASAPPPRRKLTGWLAAGPAAWAGRRGSPRRRPSAEVARAARRGEPADPPRRRRRWPARCRPTTSPPSRSTMSRPSIGMPTGYWRGAAHSYTGFFTESFIDELARTAGLEPLAFRMQMLADNPRLARCLATAASIGGWDGGPPGSGMGIACHSAFGSYIATLVEVEVTRDQRLRVLRAVCAVDCGRIDQSRDRQAADRGRADPRHLRRDRQADRDRRRHADRSAISATTACRSCATRPRSASNCWRARRRRAGSPSSPCRSRRRRSPTPISR